MSHQNETFGIMDEAYFVPRSEILNWLNNLLHLSLTKIEQLGSGAVYCQIVDVIHPGKVAIGKVNWKARHDYQFINNLKLLQNAFDKIGIKKHVQVEKLAKAKYQDNLEFIQWFKRYFDLNSGQRGANYLPEERRGNAQIDFGFAEKTIIPKTYNAGGIVQSAPTKNDQQAKRVKSPVAKKIQQKKTTIPNVSAVKNVSAVRNTAADFATNTSLLKKEESSNSQLSQMLAKELQEAKEELKNNQQETNVYKQRSKQSDMKIQMIKQILGSEQEAAMKVTLIQEILKE